MSTPMNRLTDREIDEIARRIAADIRGGQALLPVPSVVDGQSLGVFATVSECVSAAAAAQKQFVALPLSTRGKIIDAIRRSMLDNCETLAKAAFDETGYGRYEDKVVKNRLVTERTPGIEDLAPTAVSGDHGLELTEPAPFGVIGAITPVTNPTSTIICNSIGMLAAGNSVVFNVHPYAKNCCMQTIALLNKA
ncbi:MAG TPA: aldehyde dehydrogenase family protein, partial [Thermoanaerobaculia bacterium]|nr:aldehyde dehydrogenase family protein [Thermoanaerobaculia bacterium]